MMTVTTQTNIAIVTPAAQRQLQISAFVSNLYRMQTELQQQIETKTAEWRSLYDGETGGDAAEMSAMRYQIEGILQAMSGQLSRIRELLLIHNEGPKRANGSIIRIGKCSICEKDIMPRLIEAGIITHYCCSCAQPHNRH